MSIGEVLLLVTTLFGIAAGVVAAVWMLYSKVSGEMERGFAKVEAKFDSRISSLETGLRSEMHGLRSEMHEMRSEMHGIRDELKSDIMGVRSELKADNLALRTELKSEISGLRTDINGLSERVARLEVAVMGYPTATAQGVAEPPP